MNRDKLIGLIFLCVIISIGLVYCGYYYYRLERARNKIQKEYRPNMWSFLKSALRVHKTPVYHNLHNDKAFDSNRISQEFGDDDEIIPVLSRRSSVSSTASTAETGGKRKRKPKIRKRRR